MKDSKDQGQILAELNQRIEEGIYRCSLDEGFYYVNKAFVRMFGYSTEKEVLDLTPHEHYSFYDIASDPKEIMDRMERAGFVRNREILFRRKDGSRFWGLQSCYLHRTKGGVFIDGIIIDISHIKESENLLKEKNRQLQKVQEEIDRFVYSASHDLRAPLSSLLGLLNLAEMETDVNQLSHFISLMKKSVKKLDHFIIEILDYTQNARLKVEDDKVNIESLVNRIFDSLEYIDGYSKIVKSVSILDNTELITDERRLGIILRNLITNAVLYHDLKKEHPIIEVKAFIERENLRLEVIDNGKGIPAVHLDKIFKMFYRASEDSKGSGLGLFMVKECVEKLEGTINVSSTYGIGTKFEIVLKNYKDAENRHARTMENGFKKQKS